MQVEQSILDRIQRRLLQLYGHLFRMDDARWPKMIYQWTSHGRMRRERPQQSWKNKEMDFIRSTSRNVEEVMAEDDIFWPLGMDRWFLAV